MDSANPPTPPVPEVPMEEDYVLRAQIAVTEFTLRYWKYGGYVVLGVLVVAFGYGAWDSYTHKAAQEQFASIAAIDYKMPKPDKMAEYGLGPADDPADAARMADLAEGAKRYEAVAAASGGSARTLAWLKAAEAWTRAGKSDEAQAAVAHAGEGKGTNVAAFAADIQQFGALADAGKAEEAEAHLREMSSRYSGFFAEEALIRLSSYELEVGKADAALATFKEITTRFPTSADAAALGELAGRLGQAAPAAAKPDAAAKE